MASPKASLPRPRAVLRPRRPRRPAARPRRRSQPPAENRIQQAVSAVNPGENEGGATRLVVEATEAGVRLDGLLARRQVFASTSAARRALAAGIVRVNGQAAKKGAHLQAGDVVELSEGSSQGVVLEPAADQDLTVLYQDDALVAVDKPAGIASHPLHRSEE